MSEKLLLQAAMVNNKIVSMQQELTRIKDILGLMEESYAAWKDGWSGEAKDKWCSLFQCYFSETKKEVNTLQKLVDKAKEIALVLAKAEQEAEKQMDDY